MTSGSRWWSRPELLRPIDPAGRTPTTMSDGVRPHHDVPMITRVAATHDARPRHPMNTDIRWGGPAAGPGRPAHPPLRPSPGHRPPLRPRRRGGAMPSRCHDCGAGAGPRCLIRGAMPDPRGSLRIRTVRSRRPLWAGPVTRRTRRPFVMGPSCPMGGGHVRWRAGAVPAPLTAAATLRRGHRVSAAGGGRSDLPGRGGCADRALQQDAFRRPSPGRPVPRAACPQGGPSSGRPLFRCHPWLRVRSVACTACQARSPMMGPMTGSPATGAPSRGRCPPTLSMRVSMPPAAPDAWGRRPDRSDPRR